MQVRWTLALAGALALCPLTATAQAVRVPDDRTEIRAALDSVRSWNEWTLEQQRTLCEIPAPPFGEAVRGAEFARRLGQLGVHDVRIDAVGNVIGVRPGRTAGPAVLISGHLDTVFPEGTDVTVTRSGTRMDGPGIGDDCRGLAVVLAVARALDQAGVQTDRTVLFVGTVGEEGAGNLRGVRHLFTEELKDDVAYFISVDGVGHDVTHAGVGSIRYRVSYRGPGGHSYGAFGMPNPIHALGRAIAAIGDVQVPAEPKTTFSVGVIRGGTSVNSIPFEGVMDIDMRSESAEALARLDATVRGMLHAALDAEQARWAGSTSRLTLTVDTIGIRPVGSQPDSAHIVQAALAAGRALGFSPRTGASSTDANLPISLGIPAITIDGGGRGGNAHALDEWYDDGDSGWLGPQWALLITTMLAGLTRPGT